ncbi:predicted protein [Scheffersomyces stipitis CBS 6054]|uniref:Uncharacterized protein n=1 Tax=Scheffersomyces stipitis (strain ATCC 58785 / CBS 6054 / NBRC 10063 / NRRL Y-11545) TaxID=322104 RepID=A3LTE0_PICST|nr:predicted protein [Scheffersomyces stipitis CBS 6054]ABN66059.2 predicted protein [Scheffersomyces stipitis CBS 6054]KAG2732890.1 hypothetical protein G9P44_003880 [Scheffersomyces stipitis]
MSDIATSRNTRQPQQSALPDFTFTQYELTCIKETWNALKITRTVDSMSSARVPANNSKESLHNSDKNTSKDANVNGSKNSDNSSSTQPLPKSSGPVHMKRSNIDDHILNLEKFHSTLCGHIFQIENDLPENLKRNDFHRSSLEHYNQTISNFHYEMIQTSYQVTHMVQLISIMINCLEFNKSLPVAYITKVSKVNYRIHDMDALAYKVFGEALIMTVIEVSNESNKSSCICEAFTIKHQAIFNKFISKLLNILIYYGFDEMLGMNSAVNGTKASANLQRNSYMSLSSSVSASSASSRIALTRVQSEISTKSSQLSLYSGIDETASSIGISDFEYASEKPTNTHSITTAFGLDKFNSKSEPKTFEDIKESDEYESFEEEDDSFDMLNSFAPPTAKTSKNLFKKNTSNKQMPKNQRSSGRVPVHDDTQDNCTIM